MTDPPIPPLHGGLTRRQALKGAGTLAALSGIGALTATFAPTAVAAGSSQNTWPYIDNAGDPLLRSIQAGDRFALVRAGSVATLLSYVANQFHARVEPIVTMSGHRTQKDNAASGGIPTSNHRSGTAIDINGFKHPYKQPTGFTAAQVATINQICSETSGVVYWGGNFTAAYLDGMHFEINGTAAQAAAAAALVAGGVVTQPIEETLMAGPARIVDARTGKKYFVDISTGAFVHIPSPEFDTVLGDTFGGPNVGVNDRQFDVLNDFATRIRQQARTS